MNTGHITTEINVLPESWAMEAARHYLLCDYDYTEKTIDPEYVLVPPEFSIRHENGVYICKMNFLVCLRPEYSYLADENDLVWSIKCPGRRFAEFDTSVWIRL